MNFKKLISVAIALCLTLPMVACGNGNDYAGNSPENPAGEAVAASVEDATDSGDSGSNGMTGRITVVTREEGSGTRGAFVEIFEVVDDDENDDITLTAEIGNGTSVVLTSVENNPNAIGYISLGALRDTVKALYVDGAAPTE